LQAGPSQASRAFSCLLAPSRAFSHLLKLLAPARTCSDLLAPWLLLATFLALSRTCSQPRAFLRLPVPSRMISERIPSCAFSHLLAPSHTFLYLSSLSRASLDLLGQSRGFFWIFLDLTFSCLLAPSRTLSRLLVSFPANPFAPSRTFLGLLRPSRACLHLLVSPRASSRAFSSRAFSHLLAPSRPLPRPPGTPLDFIGPWAPCRSSSRSCWPCRSSSRSCWPCRSSSRSCWRVLSCLERGFPSLHLH